MNTYTVTEGGLYVDYAIYYVDGQEEYSYFEVQIDNNEFNGKIYGHRANEDDLEKIEVGTELYKILKERVEKDYS